VSSASDDPAFPLEPAPGEFTPIIDNRIRMDEPPPVRLVTVEDARLPAIARLEPQLDDFYVAMLQFYKESSLPNVTYRAENFRLRFDLLDELPARDDMRPLMIEVLSLRDAEPKLIAREIDYERQRGLVPGQDKLLLRDPASNPIELVESHRV
jgi:hypothetical protein